MEKVQAGDAGRQQLVSQLDEIHGKVAAMTPDTAAVEGPAIAGELQQFKDDLQRWEA